MIGNVQHRGCRAGMTKRWGEERRRSFRASERAGAGGTPAVGREEREKQRCYVSVQR